MVDCACEKGFPVIAALRLLDDGSFLARHHCSRCGTELFETALRPGEKLIATGDIKSADGRHVIPKGRIMRITAFAELATSATGLLFCGLLAAGAFRPEGFASVWDVAKIFDCDTVGDGGLVAE